MKGGWLCLLAATLICCQNGGDGTASQRDESLPHVLYDRGRNIPTSLTVQGDTLYWVESSPDEGPRIMRAPKNGSGAPEKLGNRSPYDVAHFSASRRHVLWQDNGTLVAFDLRAGVRRDLGQLEDDGYGGPSLSIDERWAAFADSSCRSVVTANLETGELFHAKVHRDLRGGNTSLASVRGAVFCGNGPEIVRVDLASSSSERVWSTPDGAFGVFGVRFVPTSGFFFQFARWSGSIDMNWTSLHSLDLSSYESRMLFEVAGARRVQFAADLSAPRVFFSESFQLKPIEVFNLETEQRKSLEGDAYLGILTSDDQYLYWSEDYLAKRETPKNAIYRQRKPE